MINNHGADMASFWNSYEQAATSFIAKEPDRLSWIMADYARQFCEGFRGADILEIGGGDGLDAIRIVREYQPASVVSIELAKQRVARARQHVQRAGLESTIRVEEMDAHDLKFPDDSFDVIYCNSVLLFLDRPRAFQEFVRVLRPNGFLLCGDESLAENPLMQFYRKAFPKLFPKAWKGEAEKLCQRLTLSEIEAIGAQYFQQLEHKEFYLFFSILAKIPYWTYYRLMRNSTQYRIKSGYLAAKIDDTLMRLFPVLRRWAWVAIIRYAKPIKPERVTH